MRKVYCGNSMRGTFRAADFLVIKNCNLKNISLGDVIAFTKNREGDEINSSIAHRIIRVSENLLFTKGDNNRRPDVFPVSESNLLGKVVTFEREGKTYKVRGGIAGLMRARMVYAFRRACYLLICKVRKLLPVRRIADIIFKLWKSEIQKIKFSTAAGPVIKWVHRDRTVATWIPEKNLLKTSFFYRILIYSKNLS